jgi:cold shock CspA family protein
MPSPHPAGPHLRGRVSAFDDPKGLGTITAEDGQTYLFHCTQIADGTRTIGVGQAVRFELLPKLGRYEATAIEPCAGDET